MWLYVIGLFCYEHSDVSFSLATIIFDCVIGCLILTSESLHRIVLLIDFLRYNKLTFENATACGSHWQRCILEISNKAQTPPHALLKTLLRLYFYRNQRHPEAKLFVLHSFFLQKNY